MPKFATAELSLGKDVIIILVIRLLSSGVCS